MSEVIIKLVESKVKLKKFVNLFFFIRIIPKGEWKIVSFWIHSLVKSDEKEGYSIFYWDNFKKNKNIGAVALIFHELWKFHIKLGIEVIQTNLSLVSNHKLNNL